MNKAELKRQRRHGRNPDFNPEKPHSKYAEKKQNKHLGIVSENSPFKVVTESEEVTQGDCHGRNAAQSYPRNDVGVSGADGYEMGLDVAAESSRDYSNEVLIIPRLKNISNDQREEFEKALQGNSGNVIIMPVDSKIKINKNGQPRQADSS